MGHARGTARDGAVMNMHAVDVGKNAGFFLERLTASGVNCYGLLYQGLFGTLSRCYLTIDRGAVIASQSHREPGTSLTNIWSRDFVERLLGFLRAPGVLREEKPQVFEHYYDGSQPSLNVVRIRPNGCVVWHRLANGYGEVEVKFVAVTGR